MSVPPHAVKAFANKARIVPDARTLRQNTTPQGKMERLKAIEERMKHHVQKHEALWIGRELSKLMEARIKPELHHPTPFGVARDRMSPGALAARARMNVRARITRRMTRLSRLKNRLSPHKSKAHRQSFNRAMKPRMRGPKL